MKGCNPYKEIVLGSFYLFLNSFLTLPGRDFAVLDPESLAPQMECKGVEVSLLRLLQK